MPAQDDFIWPEIPPPYTLARLLQGNDDRLALISEGRYVTRAELRQASAWAADELQRGGWCRGDVLAVWLPNGVAWLQLLFAAAQLGVLIVPISTRYKAPEVRHLLQVSRARGIVVPRHFLDTDFCGVVACLRPELPALQQVWVLEDVTDFLVGAADAVPYAAPAASHAADLLCCFSTSGTTGQPKLAAHDQASITRHALHAAQALDLHAGDTMLCAIPLNGVFGFMTAMAALAGGACVLLMAVFSAEAAAALVRQHGVTHAVGADTMFDAMLSEPSTDFSTWRRAAMADFAGVSLPVARRGEAMGIVFSGTYGSSEVFSLNTTQRWDALAEERALAGGWPVDPAIEVRVVDIDTGLPLPAGASGELQIRGPNVLAAYLNNPEATTRARTPDGWFRTGDLATGQGRRFTYLARLDDSLRLGGYLVNPAEIESALLLWPGIQGAQVVGARQVGQGDVAVAFVTCQGAAPGPDMLRAHCHEQLANYKVPVHFQVLDAFPVIHGPNGSKIQKRLLREWARQLVDGSPSPG